MGGKIKLQCYSVANQRETTTGSSYRGIGETEGSRNRDSTVGLNCLMLVLH